jgi:predicted ATPase/DNA-binding winged helix-turn-helix (wHTH) protein
MHLTHPINFGPYQLDPINAQLWRGEQALSLPPKTFAVLCYLAAHPGRLVTKEELLGAVWGGRCVSEGVLKTTIQLLRKVLQDDSQAPRYIETQPRRGYRFIAAIRPMPVLPAQSLAETSPPSATPLVGREGALDRLQGYLHQALAGEPRLVFVTGEPGIGKTALIQTFVQHAAGGSGIAAACGQCVEQYGTGEPYLPVLEALNALCHQGGERPLTLLRQYASTWLVHLPWFLTEADRAQLPREVLGATKERMLREMGEFLERWTADSPLILVLEDLHWSDYATSDLLSYLARRGRPPSRWLIVGSYRPVEVIVSEHPLKGVKQELQLHGLCQELPLELLSEQDVAQYLRLCFPESPMPDPLIQAIYTRTEGLPLCLVHVVDDLIAHRQLVPMDGGGRFEGTLAQRVLALPEEIQHLIERQFERLSPEQQRLLEAGSVAGVTFSAAAVAAALEAEVVETEARCEGLVRSRRFLRLAGGARLRERRAAGRYGFIHAFYHEIAYARLSPTPRAGLHRRLGEWLETVCGVRAGELAAELALHFEQGQDYRKAVNYLRQAAENAARRYANQEAIGYLTRALELAGQLPEAEGASTCAAVLEQRGVVRQSMGDMAGTLEDRARLLREPLS